MKERIQQELNAALKEKLAESSAFISPRTPINGSSVREAKVSVLRLLLAAILQAEKEKRYRLFTETSSHLTPRPASQGTVKEEKDTELSDEEIIDVVFSEAKKRKEAIAEFERGKREDLVSKEKQELEILQKYLPEQLPAQEIQKLVKEAIEKTGAKEPKDMGRIMAELMPKVKGRADGSLVSKVVKELLEHGRNQ